MTEDLQCKISKFPTYLVGFMLVLATALRLYGIDMQSFWLDELWSALAADPSEPFKKLFLSYYLNDANPPLYNTLLHFWSVPFGRMSEFILRFPSVLFSLASVGLAYWGGGKLYNKRFALVFAALVAVSPAGLVYAHEARSYAFLMFLMLCFLLLFIKSEKENKLSPWLLPIVLMICYTHYVAALFIGFFLIAWWATSFRSSGLTQESIFGLGVLSGLFYGPWLFIIWVGREYILKRNNLPVSGDISAPWIEFASLGFGGWLIGLFALFCIISISLKYRRVEIMLPVFSVLAFVVIALAVSYFYKPIVVARYLLMFLPFLYFALAHFLVDEKICGCESWAAPILLIAMSLGYKPVIKTDWRGGAEIIRQTPGCESGTIYALRYPAQLYALYFKDRPDLKFTPFVAEDPNKPFDDTCPIEGWAAHNVREKWVEDFVTRHFWRVDAQYLYDSVLLINSLQGNDNKDQAP